MRRSLTHQGGPTETWGEPELAAILEAAMTAPEAAPGDDLTHGFHSYPARMHPAIARNAIEALSEPGARVLDPFCGSGTVLVEALVAGRRGCGADLNPLALRVAELHTSVLGPGARARLSDQVHAIAEASEARVRARTPARAPLSAAERAWYAPHILLELAGLWEEIRGVEHALDRRALEMVLSSILVKFSRQRADTSAQAVDRRLRKGLPTEAFLARGSELVERLQALAEAVPRRARAPRLVLSDVRTLDRALDAGYRADLVLSSPPYGGTYDYHDHHARRYPWLGLSAARMQRQEIGARRELSSAPDGAERWDGQLTDALHSLSRLRAPGAPILWLIGDAQVGRRRIDAAVQVERLAPACGLQLVAGARQERPDARGGRPRGEYLLALR